MMQKTDTLTAIMDLNPTAQADFLSEFTNDELACYLERLERVSFDDPDVASSSPRANGDADRSHPGHRSDPS